MNLIVALILTAIIAIWLLILGVKTNWFGISSKMVLGASDNVSVVPMNVLKSSTVESAPLISGTQHNTVSLTTINGIGVKRAERLRSLGINNVEDLLNASLDTLPQRMNISSKTLSNWVNTGKTLS